MGKYAITIIVILLLIALVQFFAFALSYHCTLRPEYVCIRRLGDFRNSAIVTKISRDSFC